MTELDAILDDIRTNPAEDLPRLALADWLMEQDDAASRSRGEFIHARCRAASLPPRDPERAALQLRAEQLRDEHEVEWLGGLAEHLDSWDFERGMIVAGVSTPWFEHVAYKRMATCPGWKWVIGLRVRDYARGLIHTLFSKPFLQSVTWLDFRDCELPRAGASAIARSPHLTRLVSLDLGYTRLDTDRLGGLLENPRLPSLQILHLDNNGISADGVQTLAVSPDFPRLTRLDLSRNPVVDQGSFALARSAHFASLRELLLGSCGIHNRGGIALATSSALANLTLLDLSDNPLDAATRSELRERFGDRVVLD